MDPVVFAGNASERLARDVAERLGVQLGVAAVDDYPGGEVRVELLQPVRGGDVYVLQSTSQPVERHLMELLLLADAAYRAGAARVTAVIPYFGYGRQDRRAGGVRVPLGARLVAALIETAHVDRVVGVDFHAPAMESFFGIPVEQLTAVPALVERLRARPLAGAVVVAPDLGAARLAERVAGALSLPMALVHKTRVSGAEVHATGLTGEVAGRWPIVVDDMVTTGVTVAAAMDVLRAAGATGQAVLAVVHAVLESEAFARLTARQVGLVLTTDSVRRLPTDAFTLDVAPLAPLLGEAIRRLHDGESLHELASPR
ncbi:MAG: ribose-phosphate pyrophosphokinase [Dehalococcoidia bacterium]|nr:ribose-phosphate pyrophosphokinase [Dehalococcoidia bacterium]